MSTLEAVTFKSFELNRTYHGRILNAVKNTQALDLTIYFTFKCVS